MARALSGCTGSVSCPSTRRTASGRVHGLRHAAATMLLEQTGDLYVVSRHLRHSSISTTETYAKANPKKLVDAIANWEEE